MKKVNIIFLLLILLFLFSCNKKEEYTITYELNGGYLEKEINSFKKGEKIELPIPAKENFIFAGWKENDVFVEEIENKDYTLSAIWIEIEDYVYINDRDIFSQDELDYYVFVMRDGCSWCEKIKNDILRYLYLTNEEQYSNVKKLYVINLRIQGNKSTIFRSYPDSENGFYVEGAKTWDELYLPATPALLEIVENNEERSAYLIENGATAIKNKLNSSLIDKNDYSAKIATYHLAYELNGGTYENPQETFNRWTDVKLSIPTKDNSVFIGWYENDNLVTSFEKRDYHLEARWKEIKETEYLEEKDIFSIDGDYYIYFIKSTDDNSELIDILNRYNTNAEIYNKKPLYLIDLVNCNIIYRHYSESDDGNNIDGVNDIYNMYINQRKTLILISDKKATFLSSGNKDTYVILENELGISVTE